MSSLADIVSATMVDEYLVDVIDKQLKAAEGKNQFRAPGFHPSEVAGVCPRRVVLNRILPFPLREKRGDFDTGLLRIFNDGHAAHHWYQNRYLGPAQVLWGTWVCSRCKHEVEGFMPTDSCTCQPLDTHDSGSAWRDAPELCYAKCWSDYGDQKDGYRDEDKVKKRGGCIHCGQMNPSAWGEWTYKEPGGFLKELNLAWHSDGLVYIGGKWYVLEIKTMNGTGFSFLRKVSDKYKGQGHSYHYCFKQMPEPYSKAEGVLFLYVNKDGCVERDGKRRKELEFIIPWDNEANAVIDGIRMMKSSMDDHTLPVVIDSLCTAKSKGYAKCGLLPICSDLKSGAEGWNDASDYGG